MTFPSTKATSSLIARASAISCFTESVMGNRPGEAACKTHRVYHRMIVILAHESFKRAQGPDGHHLDIRGFPL